MCYTVFRFVSLNLTATLFGTCETISATKKSFSKTNILKYVDTVYHCLNTCTTLYSSTQDILQRVHFRRVVCSFTQEKYLVSSKVETEVYPK